MEAGHRAVVVDSIAPSSGRLDEDLLPPLAARPRRRIPVGKWVGATAVLALATVTLVNAVGTLAPGAGRAMLDAHDAETALEAFAAGNGGRYDGATPTELRRIDPALGDLELRVSGATYVITTYAGERSYTIARALDGGVVLRCTPPGGGGCAADGTWR